MRAALLRDPEMEVMLAVPHAATAVEALVPNVFTQTGERGDDLEGRSRREGADCPIDPRTSLVFLQRLPVLGLDARDKSVWIERWHRDHRQHVAIVRIDNHGGGAADRSQRLLRDSLNAGIEGHEDVRALLRRSFAEDTIDRSLRVAAQMAHARFAPKPLVHRGLDVRL